MEVGARIYETTDSTEFSSIAENVFDWYQTTVEYSAALEIVPVYDKATSQKKTNE